MEKHNKDRIEASKAGTTSPQSSNYADDFTSDGAQSPESRHFNEWLDRVLPLLQQQLANLGISNITPSKADSKH